MKKINRLVEIAEQTIRLGSETTPKANRDEHASKLVRSFAYLIDATYPDLAKRRGVKETIGNKIEKRFSTRTSAQDRFIDEFVGRLEKFHSND